MRFLRGVPILAVVLVALAAKSAPAAYCGAASYSRCGCSKVVSDCCEPQQCYTVMKTCRQVVWEQEQCTSYRRVYETCYEDRVINCVKYVPETCFRECRYSGIPKCLCRLALLKTLIHQ